MIYFTTQNKKGLLSVDNSFVRLSKIYDNGDMLFEFEYSVRKNEAINANATIIRTSISDKYIPGDSIIASSTRLGNRDNATYIKLTKTILSRAKALLKARKDSIIAVNKIDLTSLVDNSDPNASIRKKKYVIRSVDQTELQKLGEVKPKLVSYAHVDSDVNYDDVSELNRKKIMYDMINEGIDPTIISDMTHRSVTAHDAISGVSRKKKVSFEKNEPASLLLNSVLFNSQKPVDTQNDVPSTMQVLDTIYDDVSYVYANVLVKSTDVNVLSFDKLINTLYVTIDLVNPKNDVILEQITRTIDVSKYVRYANTPKKPPSVRIIEGNSYASVEVTNVDNVAKTFDLYEKKITPPGSKYEFVSTHAFNHNKASINVQKQSSITRIFRVVPIGSTGQRSLEFSNAVSLANVRNNVSSVSISALSTTTGIRLDIFNVPQNASAVVVKSRCFDEKSSVETIVNKPIIVDESVKKSETSSVIDQNVIDQRTYEYTLYIIDENGVERKQNSTLIKYERPQLGRVDTKITNVNVVANAPTDVSFNVASIVNDTTLDIVKKILSNDDNLRYFNDDIQKQRDFLKKLLVHGVQRVNLKTGQRDDFGQITDTFFSDAALREKRSIDAPEVGVKYRYEIYVMFRDPETIIDEIEKNAVDQTTKKPYTFSPRKFLHPVALNHGLIATKNGISQRFGIDEMLFGSVGMTAELNVTVGSENVVILNAFVEKFDPRTLVISWSIDGIKSIIDHFLIIKEVSGIRTIVGKAHALSDMMTYTYFMNITSRDAGEIRFNIIPITNDYDTLASIYTNSIIVGEV